jgi:hypothetical protein
MEPHKNISTIINKEMEKKYKTFETLKKDKRKV